MARLIGASSFPEGVLFNIELKQRYWYAAQETVDATKALADKARVVGQARAA